MDEEGGSKEGINEKGRERKRMGGKERGELKLTDNWNTRISHALRAFKCFVAH